MPRAENRKKVPGMTGRDKQTTPNPHGGAAHGSELHSQQQAGKQALIEKMKKLQEQKKKPGLPGDSQE